MKTTAHINWNNGPIGPFYTPELLQNPAIPGPLAHCVGGLSR